MCPVSHACILTIKACGHVISQPIDDNLSVAPIVKGYFVVRTESASGDSCLHRLLMACAQSSMIVVARIPLNSKSCFSLLDIADFRHFAAASSSSVPRSILTKVFWTILLLGVSRTAQTLGRKMITPLTQFQLLVAKDFCSSFQYMSTTFFTLHLHRVDLSPKCSYTLVYILGA